MNVEQWSKLNDKEQFVVTFLLGYKQIHGSFPLVGPIRWNIVPDKFYDAFEAALKGAIKKGVVQCNLDDSSSVVKVKDAQENYTLNVAKNAKVSTADVIKAVKETAAKAGKEFKKGSKDLVAARFLVLKLGADKVMRGIDAYVTVERGVVNMDNFVAFCQAKHTAPNK